MNIPLKCGMRSLSSSGEVTDWACAEASILEAGILARMFKSMLFAIRGTPFNFLRLHGVPCYAETSI